MPPVIRRPFAIAAATLMLAAVVGCESPPSSPSAGASPVATPLPSPTPVPTPLVSAIPSPSGGVIEGPALVIRVVPCTELCIPTPGTTVLADGRVIWEGPAGRALEARLTRAGLARVRDEIADHGELSMPGEYQAELRPGAEPFPRGTSVYRFEVGDDDPHAVISGEPADYAIEPQLWIIPPEMERLARLARQLLEPLGWLGPEAVEDPARPYQPERYLVLVELFPGVGAMREFRVDIDSVASPFGVAFEGLGEPVQIEEGDFPVRCLVTDAETAMRLADVEAAVGVPRDAEAWASAIAYRWDRGQGFVQVTLRQVLPHEEQPCAELQLSGFAGTE